MTSQQRGTKTTAFELGEFRVDPQGHVIVGPRGKTIIEPKIMAVLLMLAENPGKVITRQAFIDSIWSLEYGGDESLSRAISHLRKVFGDTRGLHTHIETVPRIGYRLIDNHRSGKVGAKKGSRRLFAGVTVLLAALIASIPVVRWIDGDTPDQVTANQAPIVLAVLPFDSQSSVTEDVSLAHGLADEILSALSQNPSISVIASNSSFRFRGADKKDLQALSRELNISHIVDGSVRQSPGGLRVSVHLIDAGTGLVIWSDTLKYSKSEIYSIPKVVATAVQTALGTEPTKTGTRITPPKPAAYEAYLLSKALLQETSDWNLARSIEYLENAVEIDQSFSEAWATLALARLDMMIIAGPGESSLLKGWPLRQLQRARLEANAALAIDPGSIDALLALAIIDYRERSATLVETESRFWSLLARAPNHPNVNLRMGMMLEVVGRNQQATHYYRKALDLDPLASLTSHFYAGSLFRSGRLEEARAAMEKRNVYDRYRRSYHWLAMCLLENDFQGARDFFIGLENNNLFFTKGIGLGETLDEDSPNTVRLRLLIDRLVTVAERGNVSMDTAFDSDLQMAAEEGLLPYGVVIQLLAAAGRNDAAFNLAMERLSQDEYWFRGLLFGPIFRTLRHDIRIMEFFEVASQLDYWLQTGNWPDFCADPELPYDCEEVARRLRNVPAP